MKYAILESINGTFKVKAEGYEDNLQGAKVKFHQECTTLWNAKDVISAYVMIADENLDKVEGYGEYIWHEPEPEVEPEAEPEIDERRQRYENAD